MSDKEQGVIVGKGIVKYNPEYNPEVPKMSYYCYFGYVDYHIQVYVKDNRYVVVVNGFDHKDNIEVGGQCDFGIISAGSYQPNKK